MLGFVRNAKAKAYLAEARAVYVAAQATSTEYFGRGEGSSITPDALGSVGVASPTAPGALPSSQTMHDYLNIDIDPVSAVTSTGTTATTKGNAFWTVELETVTSTITGKVKSVTYIRGGYETKVFGDGTAPETKKYVAPSGG